MADGKDERRIRNRTYLEPYDSGTHLSFTLDGKEYQFNLLDTSPGGMGMLVMDGETEVLHKLKVGEQMEMQYGTLEASIFMRFEIRHVTPIKRGRFEGHYQVGLSLFPRGS